VPAALAKASARKRRNVRPNEGMSGAERDELYRISVLRRVDRGSNDYAALGERSSVAKGRAAFQHLGRVDEFGSDEIFGIPRLHQG
jgi:hypothetical protein